MAHPLSLICPFLWLTVQASCSLQPWLLQVATVWFLQEFHRKPHIQIPASGGRDACFTSFGILTGPIGCRFEYSIKLSLALHRREMIPITERVKHVDYSCHGHDTYITPNILHDGHKLQEQVALSIGFGVGQ